MKAPKEIKDHLEQDVTELPDYKETLSQILSELRKEKLKEHKVEIQR